MTCRPSTGKTRRVLVAFQSLIALVLATTASYAEDLNCLTDTQREESTLYRSWQRQAYEALDRREAAILELKSAEQISSRQKQLREFFVQQLGGFPERTPLNARTVGTIDAGTYTIERVIFDSQPHHRITANLYLPKLEKPVPGIVVASGHSRTAKTADYNQRFAIAMATHGMAALCFDPIGQGERSQFLDANGKPMTGSTTTEHFLVGVGSTLVGRNTATYRVWDSMRAIDYITSRPEVDAERIGFTGCSGGGTLTSYVMALDDRVTCAAPACYLTTFRRLIETIGPQDSEQNIYGQIAFGMDHPDYVLMRAPKPTLISSTTNDFFSIEGSWENYRQAKLIYGRLEAPERIDLVEVAGSHGVQPQNLATITHWMKRWLLNDYEPVRPVVYPVREAAELLCLEKGQVLSLPDEMSVIELNTAFEATLAKQRAAEWEKNSIDEMRNRVRELLNVRPNTELKPPSWKDAGRVERDGYHIDKLVMQTDSDVPIPALTFHPPSPSDEAYLYLHDDGKTGDSEAGGPVEQLVEDNFAVITVDLSGQGETASGKRDPRLTDWKTYYLGYLLGQPLIGTRVEDALAAADFVAFYQKERDDPRKVHLVGVGQAGIVALHAAAMNPDLFASVTIRGTPSSWAEVVAAPNPEGQLDATVHGALKTYDLPDLVRLIGKDKVTFEK